MSARPRPVRGAPCRLDTVRGLVDTWVSQNCRFKIFNSVLLFIFRLINKFRTLIARIISNIYDKYKSITLYCSVFGVSASDHECVLASVLTTKSCDIWYVYSFRVLIILKFSAKLTPRNKELSIVVNSICIQSIVDACNLVHIYWAIEMLVLELRPSEGKLLWKHQVYFKYSIW